MAYEHLDNGVKARSDGQGDAWARHHRELGRGFQMHDLDATFGIQVFGSNTGEKLFLEYEPDHYANRFSEIRQFAVVALFDRKSNEDAAFGDRNTLSTAFYLWICRTFAESQPVPPRFFYVIGGQEPPWVMHEVDITSGRRKGDPTEVCSGRFKEVWDALGLTAEREVLRRWITSKKAA